MKLKHYYRLWKERDRIFAWKKRHHPNGKRYSWAEAFEATINNPRSFDDYWDEEMKK